MRKLAEQNRDLRLKLSQMEQALGRAAFQLFLGGLRVAACSDVVAALTVSNPADAINFYSEVLGAQEGFRIKDSEGKIAHAALQIGESQVFINSEYPELGKVSPGKSGNSSVTLTVFVDDAHSAFQRALKAGCKEVTPLKEEFWGDVRGTVLDPFGHQWILATNRESLSIVEILRRAEKEFGKPQG